MKVSQLFREKLKGTSVKADLAKEIGVAYSTIVRWYYYKNEKFARLDVVKAIEKVTGLNEKEIFENGSNN
ncbi:hypothetical protein ACQ1PF_09645 [Ornithobacterium rhinotracheale]